MTQDFVFPLGWYMNQVEIIRSLREACMAALPLVQSTGRWSSDPHERRKCNAAGELIEHALSLNADTGKPGRAPTPLYDEDRP